MRHCRPQGRRQEGRRTLWDAACAPADTSLSPAAFACLFSRSDPPQSRCCALYQVCRYDNAARPPDTATARQAPSDQVSGLSDIPHTRHEKTRSYQLSDRARAKARIFPQCPRSITPPLCLQLLRSPPAGTRAAL